MSTIENGHNLEARFRRPARGWIVVGLAAAAWIIVFAAGWMLWAIAG